MPRIRSEDKKVEDILDISGGERPDSPYCLLPAWNKIRNLWKDSKEQVVSRPFYVPASPEHVDIGGMFYDASNRFIYSADGIVYADFTPTANIDINDTLRFDHSRLRTVITAGGTPLIWESPTSFYTLPHTNVKAVATFVGAQKLRLCFTTFDEPHRVYITTVGDLTDTGTVIVDPRGIADDEYTEGYSIKNFPHEIVDLAELNSMVFVITKRGAFTIQDDTIDGHFSPVVLERIDTEILDVKVLRDEGQIFVLGPEGPKRIFFDRGFPTFSPIPLPGIEKTLQAAINESEAAISTDPLRDLLFVKANNTDDTTYVWHFKHKIWTEWDGGIDDCVSVSGTSYVTLQGENYIYTLDDEGLGISSTEMQIKSGITPVADKGLRKRLRYAHINFTATQEVFFYGESDTEFIEEVYPVYAEAEEPDRIAHYLGDQGTHFCIAFCFESAGRLVINEILVEFPLKKARLLA